MLLQIASNVLIAASAAVSPAQSARSDVQSNASVRIDRAAVVTSRGWDTAPVSSRRQLIIRGERGQPVVLRIIEYQ